MQLVYFSLVCAGLTQILVYGKIFDKIRPTQGWMGELLSCPMCTGFWSGLFLGCLGSLVSYIFAMTFDDNGLKLGFKKE